MVAHWCYHFIRLPETWHQYCYFDKLIVVILEKFRDLCPWACPWFGYVLAFTHFYIEGHHHGVRLLSVSVEMCPDIPSGMILATLHHCLTLNVTTFPDIYILDIKALDGRKICPLSLPPEQRWIRHVHMVAIIGATARMLYLQI